MNDLTGKDAASPRPTTRRPLRLAVLAFLAGAVGAFLVAALLVSIFTRKQEARVTEVRVVEVDESITDPAVWGRNWPYQYDTYRRTVDVTHTRFGGSEALTSQKLDRHPWLKRMYAGYAFSLDYRDRRGHAYMLYDQEVTERVTKRSQPGTCLHCHASILPAYRFAGEGDVMRGFAKLNALPYQQAHDLVDAQGRKLIQHPVSCVDCHEPQTMAIRVTRPGFLNGIKALKAAAGVTDYDVNRDATRQELRTYVCAQCHVEYYFQGEQKLLVYPWHKGLKVEEIEAYYDEAGYTDYTHAETGAPILKAQHPEFETYSQGVHARAGVACADCHMPYVRIGASKVSDHWVRSPLLNVNRACQPCHAIPEAEIQERVGGIQTRTFALLERAAAAEIDLLDALVLARQAGATDEQLVAARALQRKAQWRLDFVSSENSMGFHAPQETARILAESIDYARQGQLAARTLQAPAAAPAPEPQAPAAPAPEPQAPAPEPAAPAAPAPEPQAPAAPAPEPAAPTAP